MKVIEEIHGDIRILVRGSKIYDKIYKNNHKKVLTISVNYAIIIIVFNWFIETTILIVSNKETVKIEPSDA